MNKQKISEFAYLTFTSVFLFFSITTMLFFTFTNEWHDFEVFYTAAKSAMAGENIYKTVGEYNLPFWYFPWVAWMFIPFAVWEYAIALSIYKVATLLVAITSIWILRKYYHQERNIFDTLFIIAAIVPMSIQTIQVGQADYFLLLFIILTMISIEKKVLSLSSLSLLAVWMKPHLVLIFSFFVIKKSGLKMVVILGLMTLFLLTVQTIQSPGWTTSMLSLLSDGTNRTEGLTFMTLPSLLGHQENWVGTANLPITIFLIALTFLLVWQHRKLPTVPFLSLSLTASLVCAPRAYPYDLPLLIPSLIWLSKDDFKSHIWVWLFSGIFPMLVEFEEATYIVVLLVFVLSLIKANKNS